MSIRKPKSHEPVASTVAVAESVAAPAVNAAPPPATASPPPAASVMVLDLPPADANIPAVPKGAVTTGSDHAAPAPRQAELEQMPQALKDIAKFTNYTETFGTSAPPYALLVQVLTVAAAWSSMRVDTAAWDEFSVSQESLAWATLRLLLADLQTSFAKLKNGATTYPGLAALLGAKSLIARKGVATRQANKLAKAEGREPVHGKVGKQRQKAAEKAAYAAAQTVPVTPAPTDAPSVAAPAVTTAPAQTQPTVVTPANGVTNGGTHS
jgi:hypothetical protein